MSVQAPNAALVERSPRDLQRQIQARIDSLSYLPTTAAVAIKFVELGKDSLAEPADYAKVISADSSLSSKLLALANSSWAGVRTRVTNVRMAVNLLGLGTVRTLAISYCMTGLHNELGLSATESEAFWESALSKAVASRVYASLFDKRQADEAFVAGLFQDFAIMVMYSVDKQYLGLLRDAAVGVQAQLERERLRFGMDHAEVGRALAQKLELPELFVDLVAFHHNYERLCELIDSQVLREATHAAALLPHALEVWNRGDAETLTAFLREHIPSTDPSAYLADVQTEFAQLYGFFNEGKAPQGKLTELLVQTAREVADNTTALVGTVNELLREAAAQGVEVGQRIQELETQANTDPLTGLLNREGFDTAAREFLGKAARYGAGFGLCYLDVDRLKAFNDSYGHPIGDLALRTVVSEVQAALPADALFGRLGGDEFVVLLNACSRQDAKDILERITANLAAKPINKDGQPLRVSLSVGLLYVKPSNRLQPLDALLKAADKLMYSAKQAGGNQVAIRVI
jgi:diguanylate cyclase (GGDEF)-like protein